MQGLAWLLIGWALGLLSGVLAALLVYYMFARLLAPRAAGSQNWTAPRVILLVSVPLAILVLVAASVLLALEAEQAREAVAREAVRTQAAETFQRSQQTAAAKAEERKGTATAAAQASEPGQTAIPAVTVVTPIPGEPSPVPTSTAGGPDVPTVTGEPATNTPEPATFTPVPTRRPTRTPTARSVSQPAATRKPTATPTPQFPWRGEVVGAEATCDKTQLEGFALNRDGVPAGNIWIHYWAENWPGAWAKSSEGHAGEPGEPVGRNWDGFLVPYARSGTWFACVVPDNGHVGCISNLITVTTVDSPCKPGSGGVQIVRILFQQN